MRLLNEKDSLVRKSEYFNVLEQLHDVNDNIAELQRQLGSVSVHERIVFSLTRSLSSA